MPLITVDELKTYLGLTGTGEDDYLDMLVGGVNGSVARYLRRNLEATTGVVEYHSGNNRDRLYLKNRPATSITGVYVDRAGYYGKAPGTPFAADTQLTEGVDFVAESNDESEANQSCLLKLCGSPSLGGGTWEHGIGNIKVVYDYGYATVPEQVKLAAFMIATALRKQRKSGVHYTSESLGSYSYSVMAGHGNAHSAMSVFLDAIGYLKPYKEIPI